MLTTKIRAQIWVIFLVGLIAISGGMGCAPAGARALRKGERLVEEGKYSEAIKYFEQATEAFPDNAKAWNHLGLGYQYVGEAKKSAQAYQQALKLDQNLTAARYNLGSLYLDQNNPSAAVAELTTFIQLEPKSPEGWQKLGVAQMEHAATVAGAEKTRQLEAAKKSLDYAQSLRGSAETSNALGLLQIQRGRPRDAVPYFNEALQEEPNYAPALLNLAVVYHQYLGDKRQALTHYQHFLEAAPEAPEFAQVQTTVRQLENEVNPPVALANPVPNPTPSPSVAKPPATPAVPTQKPENRPESTVAKAPVTKPTAPLATPKPQPPVKKEAAIEVAKLPDEPPPVKPAQDVPHTNFNRQSLPSANVNVRTSIPPREIDQPAKGSGKLTKLNPVTWFKKKPRGDTQVTELPQIKPTLEVNAPTTARQSPTPTVAPPSTPPIPRYRYRSPSKPREGNRAEAEPLFKRGVQAQKDRRLADALENYRQALFRDPRYFEATYNLALASRDAGDLSASLSAYEQALVILPESVNARYNFAFTLQEAGYFQDAANELKKLLAQNPKETRAHLLLANLCAQRLNQPFLARDHYRKVLEAEPQHPQATQIRYWLAGHP